MREAATDLFIVPSSSRMRESFAPAHGYAAGMSSFALSNLRLRPGEEHRVTLDVEIDPFSLGGVDYIVASPVSAELVVQRTVSGNVLALRFDARVSGPCMRCLAPATHEVLVNVNEYEADDARAPDDLRTEYVKEGLLEISSWARDQIGFDLPEQILCQPGCLGLCAICGKNLNLDPHEHEDAPGDPRWAALEALRVIDAD
jgi:uncharacterized protein